MESLKDDLDDGEWQFNVPKVKNLQDENVEPHVVDAADTALDVEEKVDSEESLRKQREDERRAALVEKQEERRRKLAARVIQRGVRNWIKRKKGGSFSVDFFSTLKAFMDDQKEQLAARVQGKAATGGRGAQLKMQQAQDAFGFESLALRKPQVVEDYMAAHDLRTLLTSELASAFEEQHFPTNPFPQLYRKVRQHGAVKAERARVGDDEIKKLLEHRAEVVFQGSRDSEGRKLPICSVTVSGCERGTGGAHLKGMGGIDAGIDAVTIYGETPTLLTTDPVMMQRLVVALGPLLASHKQHQPYSGNFLVGRALVGTSIHHLNMSPFPAAIEISEECIAVGPDFEASLGLYCDHIIKDAVQVTHLGYHMHLSPRGVTGGGDIMLGAAGAQGEAQHYLRWSLTQVMGKQRSAFVSALQSNTVNKRPVYIDLLLTVKARTVRGDADRRSQEELGGYCLVRCRKRYNFTYHSGDEAEPVRCFAPIPFGSLYRGIFVDAEMAKHYADKVLPDGRGGGGGASITPVLTKPWVDECSEAIATALLHGDMLRVAALAWAPNRVRYFAEPQKGNTPADAALPAQALRLLGSGAQQLRLLSDQLDTLCAALALIELDPAVDANGNLSTTGDPDKWGGLDANVYNADQGEALATARTTAAEAGLKFVHASRTARILMGQVKWLLDEFGVLFMSGLCGEELDACAACISQRLKAMVEGWQASRSIAPRQVGLTLAWVRDICWCASMTHAALLHQNIAPLDVSSLLKDTPHGHTVETFQRGVDWSKQVLRDLVSIDSEMLKAVASFQVPASLAREAIVLRYCTDTGLDAALEDALRQVTDDILSPQPVIKTLSRLRSYSQKFLLWKNVNQDIISAAQLLLDTIKLDSKNPSNPTRRALVLGVFSSTGKIQMILRNSKPLPPQPQPAILPPPEAAPGPRVYGSRYALLLWLLRLGGAGEGPSRRMVDGKPAASVGAGAQGGVHSYLGYPVDAPPPGSGLGGAPDSKEPHTMATIHVPAPSATAGQDGEVADEPNGWKTRGWWTGADDVVRLVNSLRSGVTFPPGAYTLTQALAVRHVVVNPVPFARVGRLRFSRLCLYQYLCIEGPKVQTALQMVCRHIVGNLLHQHDHTKHVPFGIYIAPRRLSSECRGDEAGHDMHSHPDLGPGSEGPNGFLGDEQGLKAQLPGAGHLMCSPAALNQQMESVLLSMQQALTRGDTLYTCGLAWMPPVPDEPWTPDPNQPKAKTKANAMVSPSATPADASKGAYVLYQQVYNIAYMPSATTTSNGRPLPQDVQHYFRRDDHAPCCNIFLTADEAAVAHHLYPSTLDTSTLDPCAAENETQHLEALSIQISAAAKDGDFLGALDAAAQRSVTEIFKTPRPEVLGGTLRPPVIKKDEEGGIRGAPPFEGDGNTFEKNHQLEVQNPALCALGDTFRSGHSLAQQMVCLHAHMLCLASALVVASQASEVRAKVDLNLLAAQAGFFRSVLTRLLTEDCNQMFLQGLFPGLFQASDAMEKALLALVDQPSTFTNPLMPAGVGVDAAGGLEGGVGTVLGGAREDSAWQRMLPIKDFSKVWGGTPLSGALRHLASMHTSLGGLSQVASAAIWPNCSAIHRLLPKEGVSRRIEKKEESQSQ